MRAIRRWRRRSAAGRTPTTGSPSSIAQRDALAGNAPPGSVSLGAPTSPAALDKQIADAQAELADADAALQTASPNYGQLVQQVVPAADVLAALRPDEALAAITLTTHGGWSFLLRDGAIDAAPMKGDTALDHCAGQARAGEHRIADRNAAEVRHRSGAGALRRDARAGGRAAHRREGAGRRAVGRAAVAAVRRCC